MHDEGTEIAKGREVCFKLSKISSSDFLSSTTRKNKINVNELGSVNAYQIRSDHDFFGMMIPRYLAMAQNYQPPKWMVFLLNMIISVGHLVP